MVDRTLDLGAALARGASSFLFGARGTGKTLLAREWMAGAPASLSVNLLEEKSFRRYLARPGILREEVEAALPRSPRRRLAALVDEVQRVPALLNEVHALFNDHPGRVQFLLTGSSARKLKRGGANPLAGRVGVRHLHPLTYREHDPGLARALRRGGLPGIALSPADPDPLLEAYVSTYLKEEIQQEALVRRVDGFVRFLDLAAQLHGEPVNFSKLAREGVGSVPTIQEYFSILVDTLVAFRVGGWSHSVKRQLLQAPKFYFFDTGVLHALRGELGMKVRESSFWFGRLFETLVVLEAHRLNEYGRNGYKFAYWRANTGLEVDLILYRNAWAPPVAVEIKSSEDPAERDVKGLIAFLKEYPRAKGLCLCRAERRRVHGPITFYPWKEGLRALFPTP
jgi:predicted AAA+ superfamily ATPase